MVKTKNMDKVAKHIKYMGEVFEYSHSKKNILTYISQPFYQYDDWCEDGGVLVVEYRPNINNHKYLVLHYLTVSQRTGHIKHSPKKATSLSNSHFIVRFKV